MARRLLAPDGAVRETDVRDPNGFRRRYTAKDGGMFTVSDRDARLLKQEGFTEASAAGISARGVGRRCTGCGFGSFFTTCSRCGGQCVKENERG